MPGSDALSATPDSVPHLAPAVLFHVSVPATQNLLAVSHLLALNAYFLLYFDIDERAAYCGGHGQVNIQGLPCGGLKVAEWVVGTSRSTTGT